MKRTIHSLILILTVVCPATAETILTGGTINKDSVWSLSGSPYIIKGVLAVGSQGRLNIGAGVSVKFQNTSITAKLIIDGGILQALGSSGQWIHFTSIRDDSADKKDSNRDGTLSRPWEGDWGSVHFNSGSIGKFKWCRFQYGGGLNDGSINEILLVNDVDTLTVDSCEFRFSSESGVTIQGSSITPNQVVFNDDLFEFNSLNGITIQNGASPQINRSMFRYNLGYGTQVGNSSTDISNPLLGDVNIPGSGKNVFYDNSLNDLSINIISSYTLKVQNNYWSPPQSEFQDTSLIGQQIRIVTGKVTYLPIANPDTLVPQRITDLNAEAGPVYGTVKLTWTAPVEDSGQPTSGAVRGYMIRYASDSLKVVNFFHDSTIAIAQQMSPVMPGNLENFIFSPDTALNPLQRYFFAVAAFDEYASDTSEISNAVGIFPQSAGNANGTTITNNVAHAVYESTVMWTKANSPYIINVNSGSSNPASNNYNLHVANRGKLIIEAGVIVKFVGNARLYVRGSLVARGTSAEPIIFTSDKASETDRWGIISIFDSAGNYGAAGCTLSYCTFEKAGGTGNPTNGSGYDRGALNIVGNRSGKILIQDCYFINNSGNGINVDSAKVKISNCQFYQNESYPISSDPLSLVEVNGNVASGNGDADAHYLFTDGGAFRKTGSIPRVTWFADLPYLLGQSANDLTIESGDTVEISPGTRLWINTNPGSSGENYSMNLRVLGTLLAVGDSAQTILFSNTQNQLPISDPNHCWGSIIFYIGSSGILSRCLFEKGVAQTGGVVECSTSTLSITNCIFRNNQGDGIGVYYDAKPIIQNNTFSGNNAPIYVGYHPSFQPDPVLGGNTAYQNNYNGIYIDYRNGTNGYHRDAVWETEKLPYLLFFDDVFNLAENKKLTIEKGNRIIFKGSNYNKQFVIRDNATLKILGAPGQEVVFSADDTALHWDKMMFERAHKSSEIRYCIFNKGGDDYNSPVVDVISCEPLFSNIVVKNGKADGLKFSGSETRLASIKIDSSLISGNQGYGIYLADNYLVNNRLTKTFLTANNFAALHLTGAFNQPVFPKIVLDSVIFNGNGFNGLEYKEGHIKSDTTYAAVPLNILGVVTVDSGEILYLQPGSTISFGNDQYQNPRLQIEGSIRAMGEDAAPIIFKSQPDSGFMGSLYLRDRDTLTSMLTYCQFLQTRESDSAAIVIQGQSPLIKNVKIKNTRSAGISVAGTTKRSAMPVIDSVIFDSCRLGIFVNERAKPKIKSCIFKNNDSLAVQISAANGYFPEMENNQLQNTKRGMGIWPGQFTDDTVYLTSDFNYHLFVLGYTDSVAFSESTFLKIDPGVRILIYPYSSYYNKGNMDVVVRGRCESVGSKTNLIQFTAFDDTSKWYGIRFQRSQNVNMQYTSIHKAGQLINGYSNQAASVIFSRSSGIFRHNEIIAPSFNGIVCEDSSYPNLDSNSFEALNLSRLSEYQYAPDQYQNIYNTSYYAVFNRNNLADSNKHISAKLSWWGSTSGPYNPNGASSGQGADVSRFVDFFPFSGSGDVEGPDLVSFRVDLTLHEFIKAENKTIYYTGAESLWTITVTYDEINTGNTAIKNVYYILDSLGGARFNFGSIVPDTRPTRVIAMQQINPKGLGWIPDSTTIHALIIEAKDSLGNTGERETLWIVYGAPRIILPTGELLVYSKQVSPNPTYGKDTLSLTIHCAFPETLGMKIDSARYQIDSKVFGSLSYLQAVDGILDSNEEELTGKFIIDSSWLLYTAHTVFFQVFGSNKTDGDSIISEIFEIPFFYSDSLTVFEETTVTVTDTTLLINNLPVSGVYIRDSLKIQNPSNSPVVYRLAVSAQTVVLGYNPEISGQFNLQHGILPNTPYSFDVTIDSVGPVYFWGPEEIKFQNAGMVFPVQLTLAYSAGALQNKDPHKLLVFTLEKGEWIPVGGNLGNDRIIDTLNQTVTVGLDHFSTFRLGYDAVPPMVKANFSADTAIIESDSRYTFNFQFSDNAAYRNDSVQIFYRIGGEPAFRTLTKSLSEAGGLMQIDLAPQKDSLLGISTMRHLTRGFQFMIQAKDYAGNTAASDTYAVKINLTTVSQPLSFVTKRYRLISVPFQFSAPQAENIFFENILENRNSDAYNRRKIRLFTYTGRNDYTSGETFYTEYGNSDFGTIQPGRGFFLIMNLDSLNNRHPDRNFQFNQLATVSLAKDYEIQMRQGWNLIGNPFNYSISWQSVQLKNSALGLENLWILDPSGRNFVQPANDSLTRLVGYFVYSQNSGILKIPPFSGSGSGKVKERNFWNSAGSFTEDRWHVRILAQVGEYSDHYNALGADARAKDGTDEWDEHDLAAPLYNEYLTVYFNNDGGKTHYCKDIRPFTPETEGKIWKVSFNTNVQDTLYIQWQGVEQIPLRLEGFIYDPERQVALNIREEKNMQYLPTRSTLYKTLEFVMGTPDFISSRLAGVLGRPTQYTLSQNRPNPFNPMTVIAYELPENSQVYLAIYNLEGQEIRKLVSRSQQFGRYQVFWDGLNEQGQRSGSGVYFYTLRAGSYIKNKKMLMVK